MFHTITRALPELLPDLGSGVFGGNLPEGAKDAPEAGAGTIRLAGPGPAMAVGRLKSAVCTPNP
jgi:hypothetical protein